MSAEERLACSQQALCAKRPYASGPKPLCDACAIQFKRTEASQQVKPVRLVRHHTAHANAASKSVAILVEGMPAQPHHLTSAATKRACSLLELSVCA